MHLKTEKIVVYAGYRDWAISIFENIQDMYKNVVFIHVKTPQSLESILAETKVDVVILAGWSWILDDELLRDNFVIGLHPSDLPLYAGGSPLQHQIIEGVVDSKLTLFRITPQLDQGPVLLKVDLSLKGHMNEIFERMIDGGTKLLINLIDDLEAIIAESNITTNHKAPLKIRKRLKPEMSLIEKKDFKILTVENLFNLIRAREAPYPNAFIKDETGVLYFKSVEFVENNESSRDSKKKL